MTQAQLAALVVRTILQDPDLRAVADALRQAPAGAQAAQTWDDYSGRAIDAVENTGFGWYTVRGFLDGIYLERAGYEPGFSWHNEHAPEIAPDYLCVLGRQYVTAPHQVLAVAGLATPDDNEVDA